MIFLVIMSLNQRVKQGFLRLPPSKKGILLSSGLLMVSTLMPWYDERNSFGVGETYLGIQGPLFLVGLLVLSFGAITFFNLFFPLMGRNFFNLRHRGGSVALIFGTQSLLLLAVANSVFYHPEFGLNLANKGTRFGMMMALFSVGLMILTGFLTRRKENNETLEMDANVEPVEMARAATVSPVFTPMPVPQAMGGETVNAAVVDPLTLDAKTRYRMMQTQNRTNAGAHGNLWGNGPGMSYGRPQTGVTPRVREEQSMDF